MKSSSVSARPSLFRNPLFQNLKNLGTFSFDFQFAAVVVALACVASAQLPDGWDNQQYADFVYPDPPSGALKNVPEGRGLIFRRTSTRFEKLEQTAEDLGISLRGTIKHYSGFVGNECKWGLFSETSMHLTDTTRRLETSLKTLAETQAEVVDLKQELKGKRFQYIK